jgi:hypothetical protein
MSLTPLERNEMVRRAVLDFLAPRQALSFDADIIRQRIASSRLLDFNPDADEVAAALAFLRSAQFITFARSSLGNSNFYQATSAGVLAYERGALEPST